MSNPPDELAIRRRARAERERPSDLVRALELIDWTLVDYLGEISGDLLVPADDVRAVLRRVDRLVLDQFHAARDRDAK
jgi:hypothetical protein